MKKNFKVMMNDDGLFQNSDFAPERKYRGRNDLACISRFGGITTLDGGAHFRGGVKI
jgi:hypothetical protein